MKTTRRSGTSYPKILENAIYFSTGSFKNGSSFVRASTLESDATKDAGIVQKMQRKAVNTKLISSPKCLVLLLFLTFFQLSKSFIACWIGEKDMLYNKSKAIEHKI